MNISNKQKDIFAFRLTFVGFILFSIGLYTKSYIIFAGLIISSLFLGYALFEKIQKGRSLHNISWSEFLGLKK